MTEHLLALAVDRIGEVAWVTAQVNSEKKIAPPAPIPRPGRPRGVSNGHRPDHKSQRRHASVADMQRFFGQAAGR